MAREKQDVPSDERSKESAAIQAATLLLVSWLVEKATSIPKEVQTDKPVNTCEKPLGDC